MGRRAAGDCNCRRRARPGPDKAPPAVRSHGRLAVAGDPRQSPLDHPSAGRTLTVRTRVLLAAVVGAALTTAGTVVQVLVRNPLADPYLLGDLLGGQRRRDRSAHSVRHVMPALVRQIEPDAHDRARPPRPRPHSPRPARSPPGGQLVDIDPAQRVMLAQQDRRHCRPAASHFLSSGR